MKGKWCDSIPVVTVEQDRVPKPVTLIVPYYEQPQFFARQLAHWAAYPDDVARHLSIIVVDDGSPHRHADAVPQPPLADIRLFRIEQDVRWNWLAARNIGFHHARDGWCLVTDMDHVVPVETLRACVYGIRDAGVAYGFSRRERTGQAIHSHSASFLMTRGVFWKTGGYDETLSGYYGTDGDFRRRLATVARLAILTDVLERHEFVLDASITTYRRKQPEDAAVSRLVKARKPGWTPKVLSFPYHEVMSYGIRARPLPSGIVAEPGAR